MDSGSIKDKKIFELTDVYEEKNGRNHQEVIVIDGRGYEKNTKVKNINDIVNEKNEHRSEIKLNDEIIQMVTQIAEKVARETVPDIAERIIREEIEKLKKLSGNQ